MKESHLALATLAALCTSIALPSQTPLANINATTSQDPTPTLGSGVAIGSKLFFSANDTLTGQELWVADGAGVRRVTDLYQGFTGSGATPLVSWQGDLLFGATDGTRSGLWRSDGTAAGTSFLATAPKVLSGAIAFGGAVLFVGSEGTSASSVWITDGTSAGTRALASTAATGPAAAAFVLPTTVVFLMQNGSVVASDGTTAGSRVIAAGFDFMPVGVVAEAAAVRGNLLLFSAKTLAAGHRLFRTDGTSAGTGLVVDLASGGGPDEPLGLVAYGGLVWFHGKDATGAKLWSTDGTKAGTTAVTSVDIQGPMTVYGGRLWFAVATSANQPYQLWSSNGTPAGTSVFLDASATEIWYPTSFKASGGKLWFAAYRDASGFEPWVSDGTSAGTHLVTDLRPGTGNSVPVQSVTTSQAFTPFSDLGIGICFAASVDANGPSLWLSDGTAAGTRRLGGLLNRIDIGSAPGRVLGRGQEGFFVASEGPRASTIWRTDGTPAGTRNAIRTPGFTPDSIVDLGVLGDTILFRATLPNLQNVLCASDGSDAGTRVLSQVHADVPAVRTLSNYRGRAWFAWQDAASGVELWSTDGTAAGTTRFADLAPGTASSNPRSLFVVGSRLFFWTGKNDSTLWVTDGTLAGTTSLVTLSGTVPSEQHAVGDVLVFRTIGVWRSDGTVAGTYAIEGTEIVGGLAPWRSRVYFTILRGGGPVQSELWVADASGANKLRVFAIASRLTAALVAREDALYFNLAPAFGPNEIWTSDGTTSGTHLALGSRPRLTFLLGQDQQVEQLEQKLLLFEQDSVNGNRLYASDGTEAGTRLLAVLNSSISYAEPQLLGRVGRTLILSVDDGLHGTEPFALDLAAFGEPLAASFGEPCGARLGRVGLPTLGNFGFWVTLDSAPQNAPLLWAFGATRQDLPLFGCTFHVGGPLVAIGGVTSALGSATLPVLVPNDPRLYGAEGFFQALVANGPGIALSDGMQVVVGTR